MKKKQRRLSLFLCAALVVMSACQTAPAPSSPAEIPPAPSQESPAPAPSSVPEEIPSSLFPETSPAETPPDPASLGETLADFVPYDPTELKVPLRMTEPWGDVYPFAELGYTTQAEVDLCRRWLCDLKVEDITALYGVSVPLGHYWTGEMSPEDSRKVVDLLRSVAPDLAPLSGGNPPTGGGWNVAIHIKDEAAVLGFNGEWVTFCHQGKGYIFDGTAAPVKESCGRIEGLLYKYANNSSPVTETYFPAGVRAIYALDRDAYTMAEVKDGYVNSKTIWEGLENRTPSGGEPSGYGYLIFTGEGKEYVYMEDTDGEVALNKACQAALIGGPLHPSWLIHMTPERMVSADIMGTGTITDRDKLLALAEFLKEEVTVGPQTSITSGPVNPDMPAGVFVFTITFDSGVKYKVIGYDELNGAGSFSIYASDLDKTVGYSLDKGVAAKITAFLRDSK